MVQLAAFIDVKVAASTQGKRKGERKAFVETMHTQSSAQ
jgi:hypothetical protein